MKVQNFIYTLYNYIWKYILDQYEIDNKISFDLEFGSDGKDDQLWAYDIITLIANLNSLRKVYNRVIGSIDIDIRESLINLMTWADKYINTLIFFICDKNMLLSKPKKSETVYTKNYSVDGKDMMFYLMIRPNN